MTIFFR